MLDNGDTVDYEQLVFATGSRPRILPLLSPATPGVFYLRTLDDALALRVAMQQASSLIVIGGGVIGLEVAAVATQCGITTTIIEAGPRLMARAATPMLSQVLEQVHAAHGVSIRCNAQPIGFEYGNDSHTVTLSDGTVLVADLIVVGIGVVPEITVALMAGIVCGVAGIVVDGHGRTNVDGVFAAGEVAYAFNTSSGWHERHESWHHAAAHGQHVGHSLVAAGEDYSEICGYWSDQYDLNINVFGSVDGDDLAIRGDIDTRQFAIYHLRQGAIVGITCVNSPKDLRVGKQLVKARAVVSKTALEDPRTNLAAEGLKAA
jgi:NADPH-dependent 2,4-dienoyl-CoA reductase/sulfur reductase-like enzyme